MQTISYPISTHVKFLLYPESYFSMIKVNVLFFMQLYYVVGTPTLLWQMWYRLWMGER